MQPKMMHSLATCLVAEKLTQVCHFMAEVLVLVTLAVGLFQNIQCISLSIIEVAFESSPAVLIVLFQLCALQRMRHDPWNVTDLQEAALMFFERQVVIAGYLCTCLAFTELSILRFSVLPVSMLLLF